MTTVTDPRFLALMDWSTIRQDILETLKVHKIHATYRLDQHVGSACFLDPPGYPTYFLRHIYTSRGNNPPKGPDTVIAKPIETELRNGFVFVKENVIYAIPNFWEEGCRTWEEEQQRRSNFFKSLWAPLPLDHSRTRLWVRELFRHFKNCYRDEERLEYGKPGTLIFPLPYYKLKTFRDDWRWNDEYRTAAKAEIDAFNKMEVERATKIATVDNHLAVISIRQHYPEYQPDISLLEQPGAECEGNWWTLLTEPPTPDKCIPSWGTHPINHAWCQWCGWREEEVASP